MAVQHHGPWMGRCALGLVLSAALALPVAAQDSPPPARPLTAEQTAPEAAAARLDFPAALDALAAEIAADPTAPAPRLARAGIHVKMQRPALALADLGAVLAADPANLAALRARVAIWEGQQAWNRARDDLDAALAVAPDNPQLLALRGQINARAGVTDAARADFAAALAAAPGDADILRARDELLGDNATPVTPAAPAGPTVVFGQEAVMSPEFTVAIGDPDAPATLHIVHAAPDLAAELAAVDPALIDRAVAAQALRVIHLFTYTGEAASIWGSLALICAGPVGYAATHAALSDSSGHDALAAAGAGDMAPLERLLTAAYSVAGIDEGLVRSCALDRLHGTRYLADWQAHRDAGAWRGVNLLDTWPVWVFDGAPIGPVDLTRRLNATVPAPQTPQTAPSAEVALADDRAAVPAPDGDAAPPEFPPADAATLPADDEAAPPPVAAAPDDTATDTPTAPPATPAAQAEDVPAGIASPAQPRGAETTAPDTATAEAPEPPGPQVPATMPAAPVASAEAGAEAPPDPAPSPDPAAPPAPPPDRTPEPVHFPERPEPVDSARVPVALRGIYAPSLAACLDYLAGIEDPDRIDAVLPATNPLDGPALGTLLVTSRRAYLFNALDTECAIAGEGAGGDWQGDFVCASPLAPEAAPRLTIAPSEPDGTAPRISASFAGAAPVTLRQCRALGQLGNAFAPLWARDDDACSVGAAVEQGRFAFTIDPGGNLVLRIAPRSVTATAGAALLYAVIDGAAIGEAPGRWDGTGWQMSLGPFDAAAERLGWGMFLDLRTAGDPFEARLPLFGSSAAMDSLAACAATSQ